MNGSLLRSSRPGARVLAVCAAVSLVASGCGGYGQDEPPEGEAPFAGGAEGSEANGLEPAAELDPGEPPAVEVLDHGDEERHDLRYAPTAGEPVVTDVGYSDEGTTRFGTEPEQATSTPRQTLRLSGASEPGVEGAQKAVATVLGLESEAADSELADAYATAEGFELEWDREPTGALTGISFAAPSAANDAARVATEVVLTALSDVNVVFPDEPVGVGAQWTVTREVQDAAAPTRITTYTLTDVDEETGRVSVDLVGDAPIESDEISGDGLDGGAIVLDVSEYEFSLEGSLTIDLRAAVPVEGEMTESTSEVYSNADSGIETSFASSRTLTFQPAG